MMKKSLMPVADLPENIVLPTIGGYNYFTGDLAAEKVSQGIMLLGQGKERWADVWALLGGALPAPAFPENARFYVVAAQQNGPAEKSVLNRLKTVRFNARDQAMALTWERATYDTPQDEARRVSYALVILPLLKSTASYWDHAVVGAAEARAQKEADDRVARMQAAQEADLARRKRLHAKAAGLGPLL